MILDYLKFLYRSKNEHSLHSPFLFQFYLKTVKKVERKPIFIEIENLRKELLNRKDEIEIVDFGAGSKVDSSKIRKVNSIAKNSEKPKKVAQFLHSIIHYFGYKNIFDLGTSFGLTTAYLASANQFSRIKTFEGCPNTTKIAKENFKKLSLDNIEFFVGNLDETLQKEVNKTDKIDFAFFDANHQLEPTIRYFEICLEKATEETCFVFDDIYWSGEMKMAWDFIKNHPKVMISIDFFWIGVVFFRKNQPKQDFKLRL